MGQMSSEGKNFHVAVIGGGASGTLSAIQLLQRKLPIIIHVFNDEYELGRGMAYSPISSQLVLNVPARNMSAFPDLPAHFTEWLQQRYGGCFTSDSFVPRFIYGDYLRETLRAAAKSSAGCLRVYDCRIKTLLPQRGGYTIFYGRQEIFAHAVILALGNVPPRNPCLPYKNCIPRTHFISNPWQEIGKIQKIWGRGRVLILGSGLTAVDTILQLRQQGHQGKILLISRRGLWPSVHLPCLAPICCSFHPKRLSPRKLVRALRREALLVENQGGNWRQVIDGLRPKTNDIWAGWTLRQHQSFIRHLESYWNVYRHRISPAIWDYVNQEIKSGKVELKAGRIVTICPQKNSLSVMYRPRHEQAVQELQSEFVINCTGPETLHGERLPELIQFLLDQNLGQLDPLGYGLVTAPNGGLLNADGQAVHGLFTVGPLRKGKLWETTAIPEIRVQAKCIASEICRYLTPKAR